MPRPPRLDLPDGVHHVMNRGRNRDCVFLDDSDRVEFGQRLAELHERWRIQILAYCLMGNHYHLLLRCPEAGLSEGMQRLSSIYTRHINARHGLDGQLFRGRFTSRLITDEAYLMAACRYIHRNPLDIVGVCDIADYRWSSHRTYLGHRTTPAWMNTSLVLDHFEDRCSFDRFVRDDETTVGHHDPAAIVDATRLAAKLVLAEVGTSEESALNSFVHTATIAALEGRTDIDAGDLAAGLGIPTRGALRTARSRAHQMVGRSETMREVGRRTIALAA